MDDFKINQDFAKKYNKYREKEELQKLKSRYGDVSDDSSDSESEDENAEAVTPGLERDFLRTLSYLKNKDPAIYDKSKKFYEEQEESDEASDSDNEKKNISKPMFLKDYERKVILENEGKFVEDAPEENEVERETRESSLTYQEEQMQLKEDIRKAISMSDNAVEDDEGLLVKRNISTGDKENEEEEFRKWLKTPDGQISSLEFKSDKKTTDIETIVSEVQPLKEYWTDPSLDDGEKFLRDYILDRKYLDPDADAETPTYDEIIGAESDPEDEDFEKKSEMFERKYNFRYEEDDQEFIKSYPRTIGTSVRRKEDIRKKKRDEKKIKDEEKKRKKQEELKQLKALKKKEILEKIQKLQEATGNKDMNFSKTDLEVDFNPEEYDKRMQELFSSYDDDYEEEKPVFSDVEDEMEDCERYWDDYDKEESTQPDCEDPDFVMDCDYDPEQHQKIKETKKGVKKLYQDPNISGKDKRTKKSAFYDSVSKPKPMFDPNEKSFEKYLDEYYALDYEDIIGDLPCRFKYRQVVANDFGLSTDEILTATDKELNSWCSLKRAVQYRKEADENLDVGKYRKKGRNVWKKARVLKSVYTMPSEEDGSGQGEKKSESTNDQNNNHPPAEGKKKKMNSRKRRRLKERAEKLKLLQEDAEAEVIIENLPVTNGRSLETPANKSDSGIHPTVNTKPQTSSVVKTTKRKINHSNIERPFDKIAKLSHDRLKAYGLEPKKFLKKIKYGSSNKNGGT